MLFFLLIPALLLIYYYYRQTIPEISKIRKVLLFALRTISVIILLILIFNPILNLSRTVVSKPQIIFLTDNSYSMDLPGGFSNKLEMMKDYREKLAEEFVKLDYEITDFFFADGIDGRKTSSNLTRTLQDMAKKVNLQKIDKIFLLSDGWFRDEQLDIVNRMNIPVWTIHPDYEYEEFDIGINSLFYNPTAYTEEENDIIVDVFADNYSGQAEISFHIDDRMIESQIISFEEENLQQITFTHIFDNAGLYPIRAEIKAEDEQEHNTGNNIYPGAIRVLDKRSGVYILTDVLNWEVKFLNNALRRDDRKDVEIFHNPSTHQSQTLHSNGETVISGRDQVPFSDLFPDHLQLLILINNGNLRVSSTQYDTIERFVGNGGGLLFIGQPVPELENLLAVRKSSIERTFRTTLQFTPESRRYQTFSNLDSDKIPTIDHLYVEPLLEANILGRFNNDEESPAIIYNEYNQGRVLSLALFNLWRWQLRGEGEVFNEFVTNVASWLSNPTETSFIATTDKNSYFLGEPVDIRLTAYDETLAIHQGLNPKMYLYDEDDNLLSEEFLVFDSRYYNITIEHLAAGSYKYEIIDSNTGNRTDGSFIVSDIDAERRNRGYNFPLLAYLSRQSNGSVLLEEDLSTLRFDEAQSTTERIRFEIPLYRHWLIIALFLLSFCLELYLRKKWGLL